MAALAMLPVIHRRRWETLGKRQRRIKRSVVMERVMPTKAPRHSRLGACFPSCFLFSWLVLS